MKAIVAIFKMVFLLDFAYSAPLPRCSPAFLKKPVQNARCVSSNNYIFRIVGVRYGKISILDENTNFIWTDMLDQKYRFYEADLACRSRDGVKARAGVDLQRHWVLPEVLYCKTAGAHRIQDLFEKSDPRFKQTWSADRYGGNAALLCDTPASWWVPGDIRYERSVICVGVPVP